MVSQVDPATGRDVYTLTPEGQKALATNREFRKRIFPSENVKPLKNPLPPEDKPQGVGQTLKGLAGPMDNKKVGDRLNQARHNLSSVGQVVDKNRAKLLYSTLLPALQSGDYTTWQAGANGIGRKQLEAYQAKMAESEAYNPDLAMELLLNSKAQAANAIATERGGANYLSYDCLLYTSPSPRDS